MKKHLFLSILLLFVFHSLRAQWENQPFVIPALKHWESKGKNTLISPNVLAVNAENRSVLQAYLETFQTDLNQMKKPFQVEIRTASKPLPQAIYFELNPKFNPRIGEEGYQIQILEDQIVVKANTPIGAFWATRTLLQLWEQSEMLPMGQIEDYPDYRIRGFVLDVGRKFFSLDFLKNYVKFMSYYKMNDFQIHLNDNGFKDHFLNDWSKTYAAFRLENETYPGLTAKDGAYSKKDFKALQQLAIGYGVNILPEIDAPAHVLAFTQYKPSLGSKKYGMDHLDLDNPEIYPFMENIFKEYISGVDPVFIGKEVHIGTDEYAKEESEKFRSFTNHLIEYVEGMGKKVRMWGALTHAKGKTPVKVKDVVLNEWYNGYAQPKDMMKLGYEVISTPDAWLYIVPMAGYYNDFLDNRKIYNEWAPNVIGKEVFEPKHPQILGGSFAVWNDVVGNGISERDVHFRVFKSMQVLAQKMWQGSKPNLNFETFESKAKAIGESPGLQMLGNILPQNHTTVQVKLPNTILFEGKNAIVNHDLLAEISLPFADGIGYNYTVRFDIKPFAGNASNAVVFCNRDTEVKLKQDKSQRLGFSRDGYNFTFDYVVPENEWTQIAITGNYMSTSLYVNGKLQEVLKPQRRALLSSRENITTVQTLFFPLQKFGKKGQTFLGAIANMSISNFEWKP